MTDDTTRARRARRWAEHDAKVPYRDEQLVSENGGGKLDHGSGGIVLLRAA